MKLHSLSSRRTHLKEAPSCSISFIAHKIDRAPNMAHILRLAEALDADVHFVGTDPTGERETAVTSAFGSWRQIPFQTHATFASARSAATGKHNQVQIIAVEVANDSVSCMAFQPAPGSHLVLVVGNEDTGLPAHVLAKTDAAVYVPMLGTGTSLNVGMALAVAAYQLVFARAVNPNNRLSNRPEHGRATTRGRVRRAPAAQTRASEGTHRDSAARRAHG
jgi:tRNA G18 (ribose-2'-O)-methylase SpoU